MHTKVLRKKCERQKKKKQGKTMDEEQLKVGDQSRKSQPSDASNEDK